jgi:hypothetical protein
MPAATRAGQNAIKIQMTMKMIDPNHQPLAATSISTSLFGLFCASRPPDQ